MSKRLFLLIGSIVLLSIQLMAQKSPWNLNLEVTEAGKIPSLVKKRNGERFGDSTLVQLHLDVLVSNLHSRGYLEAGIDSVYYLKDTVYARLHLGGQYKVGQFEYETDSIDRRIRRFRPSKRKVFHFEHWEEYQSRLLNSYLEDGYPFAQLTAEEIRIDSNWISGSWRVVENPRFVWDSIELKGAGRLIPEYLQHYLGIYPGKVYQESRFQAASNRIGRLEFVKEIKPVEIEFGTNGKAKLYTYLEKQAANRFDGILGLLSNSERDGKLEVTGELNLYLVNSFRRGEKIFFNWQKLEAQTQRLATRLEYPYAFHSKLGADIGFKLHKQDTSYLTTETNLGVMFYSLGGNYIKFNASLKKTSLLSTKFLKNQTVLPQIMDSKTLLYGVEFRFQNLDYPHNPQKGWDVFTSLASGNKRIQPNSQLPENLYQDLELKSLLVDVRFDVSYFQHLYRRWGLKLRAQGGLLHNDNLFENDLYRVGGLKTLRGFDEELFRASAYAIFNGELRYLPGKNSAFYLFWDGGGVRKEVMEQKQDDYPWGVGLGMNFDTGAGLFSLNYAVGKRKNIPLEIRSAKIHFGFVSRF